MKTRCLIATSIIWSSSAALPTLLARAGASVTALSPGFLRLHGDVSEHITCAREPTAAAVRLRRLLASRTFDFVVVADDALLRCMLEDPGCDEAAKLLPVDPANTDAVRLLASKFEFVRRAAEIGITVPESRLVTSAFEALVTAAAFGFPVVLKGDGGSSGSEVRVCADATAVLSAAEYLLALDSCVLVERFIEGSHVCAAVLYDHGSVVACKTYKAECFYPTIYSGSTVHTYFYHEAMVRTAASIGAATKYHGIAAIDFIFDGVVPYTLEFNPRQTLAFGGSVASRAFFAPHLRNVLSGIRSAEPCIDAAHGATTSYFPAYLFYLANTRPQPTRKIFGRAVACLAEFRPANACILLWQIYYEIYCQLAVGQPRLRGVVRKLKAFGRTRKLASSAPRDVPSGGLPVGDAAHECGVTVAASTDECKIINV